MLSNLVDPLDFASLLAVNRGEPSASLLEPAQFLQAQLEASVDDRAQERIIAIFHADYHTDLKQSARLLQFLAVIAIHFRESPMTSIRSAVRHFTNQKSLREDSDSSDDATACVFVGIGWITKLYTPDLGGDTPLRIIEKQGPCFHDAQLDVKLPPRSMTELLRNLGGLLPTRSVAEAPINIV